MRPVFARRWKNTASPPGGEAFGSQGGEDVEIYRELFKTLVEQQQLSPEGVDYNPYHWLEVKEPLLGLVRDGDCQAVPSVQPGDKVEVLLPQPASTSSRAARSRIPARSCQPMEKAGKSASPACANRPPASSSTWAKSCAASRKWATWRSGVWTCSAARTSCATTPPPTCCMPHCTMCSASMPARPARWSLRTTCASTSTTRRQ